MRHFFSSSEHGTHSSLQADDYLPRRRDVPVSLGCAVLGCKQYSTAAAVSEVTKLSLLCREGGAEGAACCATTKKFGDRAV